MDWKIQEFGEQSYNNRDRILTDTICSCYYCRKKYTGSEIKEWIRFGEKTALCPKCGIDAVVPLDIPEDILKQAQDHWFTFTRD